MHESKHLTFLASPPRAPYRPARGGASGDRALAAAVPDRSGAHPARLPLLHGAAHGLARRCRLAGGAHGAAGGPGRPHRERRPGQPSAYSQVLPPQAVHLKQLDPLLFALQLLGFHADQLLRLGFATPVQFWCGWRFHRGAWLALRGGRCAGVGCLQCGQGLHSLRGRCYQPCQPLGGNHLLCLRPACCVWARLQGQHGDPAWPTWVSLGITSQLPLPAGPTWTCWSAWAPTQPTCTPSLPSWRAA